MKTRILHIVMAFVMAMIALPMMAQDCMEVYFKDGSQQKFYLEKVKSITTSRTDANGVQHSDYDYQHITTLSSTYIYALNDVDSIAFTKYNQQQVRQDLKSAMTSAIPILGNCKNIRDAESHLSTIKSAKGVEDAWSDGHELYIKINNWDAIPFHFSHDEVDDEESASRSVNVIREMMPLLADIPNQLYRKPRVVIANQQHSDESRNFHIKKRFEPLLEEFAAVGFDTAYVVPTIDFFITDIFKYDIVFLVTHGGYNKETKVHRFITYEELGRIPYVDQIPSETWDEWEANLVELKKNPKYGDNVSISYGCNDEVRNGVKYWISHPSLRENFFNSPNDGGLATGSFSNPNSILFNVACHSMEGNDLESSHSLAQKFIDRGLGVYYGYNESNYRGQKAGYQLFSSMLKGKSNGRAYIELDDNLRVESDKDECAVLTKLAAEGHGLCWLAPVYTEPVDKDKVTQEFIANNKVVLSGVMTTNAPKEIEKGFKYGISKSDLSQSVLAELTMKTLGKGNLFFSAPINNLELNKTYFYCAYSFDKSNYQYGDTLFFTLGTANSIEFSNDVVSMVEGSEYHIGITSEKGVYSAVSSSESVATVNVEGNDVIIIAVGVGSATIKVTNTDNLKEGEITVTVTPVPVIPDLQVALQKLTLEVGEKVTFDVTAGSGKYEAISENENVAMASVNGKDVTIVGVTADNTKIIIKDTETTQTVPIEIVVIEKQQPTVNLCPDDNHPHWIDLGLPSGTKWRCCNEGATKPEVYGEYFSFGKVSSAPSLTQFQELIDHCSTEWTTHNGVTGRKFTASNGASLFFPSGGHRYRSENGTLGDIQDEGLFVNIWTSTIYDDYPDMAYIFGSYIDYLGLGECSTDSKYSEYLAPVRPVIGGTPTPDFPDLKISVSTLSLEEGDKGTIQVISGSGKYRCVYENNGTITAVVDGNTVNVTALKAGQAMVHISDTQSGQQKDVTVTVKAKPQTTTTCPDNNHPHLIDLGLPSGTKWACCNVGASTPEAYGEYYAWGETSTKAKYTEYNYNLNINSDIAGTSNDVAHVKWQGSWRMPTKAQAQELIDNCQYNFGKQNGVYGGKFKGPNGKVLFLPAAGFYNQAGLSSPENAIMYWTSSTSDKYATSASSFTSNRDQVRFLGLTVRPVSGGETYPNLTLASTATLNLKTRQNSGYDITSGSGSYSVKSSNNNVATAEITDFVSVTTSQKGKSVRVVAVGVGNATITVTDNLSGQTASFNVSVTQNVDLLKLSTYSLSLKEGESGEVLITSSGNGNILIATSDASVASFTSSGNKITVKGLKAGTCTVSVNDGQTGETANVAVTVTARQFVLSNYGPINVPSGTSYVINILNGGREGVMVNQTNNDICYVGLDVGIVAIIGVNPGKDYVTITDQKSNEEVVVEVNVTDPAVALGTPAEAVDLGLPSGTKWATFNVGAVKPADFGGFYAWGETVQKTDYSYDDYTIWSKYSSSGSRVRLSSSDDVATKLWGGSWHMPTYEQMKELVNNCSWFWTTINGVCGHLVLGSNYHVIFMPAAGTKADGSHNVANRRLTYWTSDSNNSSTAYCMYSWEDDARDVSSVSRTFGYSVRPVK